MQAGKNKKTQKINYFRCLLMNSVLSNLLGQKRKQWFRNRLFSQSFDRDAQVIKKNRFLYLMVQKPAFFAKF